MKDCKRNIIIESKIKNFYVPVLPALRPGAGAGGGCGDRLGGPPGIFVIIKKRV